MAYHYPRSDPHWVEAEKVEAAAPDRAYVDFTVYGVCYRNCRSGWSNLFFDKTKSDTLIQTAEGDWLKVWWRDADVIPFSG